MLLSRESASSRILSHITNASGSDPCQFRPWRSPPNKARHGVMNSLKGAREKKYRDGAINVVMDPSGN